MFERLLIEAHRSDLEARRTIIEQRAAWYRFAALDRMRARMSPQQFRHRAAGGVTVAPRSSSRQTGLR